MKIYMIYMMHDDVDMVMHKGVFRVGSVLEEGILNIYDI